ncbi:MAG TPA: ABC transporter substrate-binding protein, partial [Rhodobacteraceae bacterium]|nr:ABC transporter substrate-binding protein [Paracoccaceae bacterium]
GSRMLYDRLVEFAPGSTRIVPGLARSWTMTDDGLSYLFHLREGVRFHATKTFTPTRPLNADDVVFSFKRQLDGIRGQVGSPFEYARSMGLDKLIRDVIRVDDRTVKFVLYEPTAPFLNMLAMDFASIHSAEYAGALLARERRRQLDRVPVGSGPFRLLGYNRKKGRIRYGANAAYWRGAPGLDTIVFRIVPSAAPRFRDLRRGRCLVAAYPNAADIIDLKLDRRIAVADRIGLNTTYLAFNTQKAPFSDPRVRRALSLAVDREAIIARIFKGAALPAKTVLPPGMWGYNADVVDDPYAPAAARRLLKEAGAEGLTVNLWTTRSAGAANADPRKMAAMIRKSWEKIGVRTKIIRLDRRSFMRRSREGGYDAILLGWESDNGDPDNFMNTLLGCRAVGGTNRARWCYRPYEYLIRMARRLPSRIERARLYMAAQYIVKDQAPWLPLAHARRFDAYRKTVTGFVADPLGRHFFHLLDIRDKDGAGRKKRRLKMRRAQP